MTMFDSTKSTLATLLEQIQAGKIQLPDFQRDYVWNEDAVISLLASVAKGYPVGALLLLERGGAVDFKPRGIEGTAFGAREPDLLLLDGQQRMTSLYQALWSQSPAIVRNSKGTTVERYFYIDIDKALAGMHSFEEVIVTVGADRKRWRGFGREVELDLSAPELEHAQNLFPLHKCFEGHDWFFDWRDHWRAKNVDVSQQERAFDQYIVRRFQRYEMPIISLSKENSREAICTIFEKVNVGGVKLDAFELVTAIYAADGFDLRKDWSGTAKEHGRIGRMRKDLPKKGIFADLANTDFLQACTILHTRDRRAEAIANGSTGKAVPPVACTREALLGLPLSAYQRHANAVEAGFLEAARFLSEQKILWGRDLPYPTQMVALAAFFAASGKAANNASSRAKLEQWYWSGVLGEYYGSATDTKIARDVPQLVEWMDGGEAPRTISETFFQVDRLDSLRMRLSAAYKGFHALLMRRGCRDFISGKGVEVMTVFADQIDIHHIFPRKWCEANDKPRSRYDSIINKTPLSAESNRIIGGDAPSVYLAKIERRHKLSPEQLDGILRTHLIEPAHLRRDNFEAFYDSRKRALAELARDAQGKEVIAEPDHDAPVAEDDVTMDEEDTLEDAA